ncbi:hypothetical protein BC940DRAFT_33557 [Gongronella butleri]|nr:hypothetical protein BC940DRAFT_33557 [Gongronella butleri]
MVKYSQQYRQALYDNKVANGKSITTVAAELGISKSTATRLFHQAARENTGNGGGTNSAAGERNTPKESSNANGQLKYSQEYRQALYDSPRAYFIKLLEKTQEMAVAPTLLLGDATHTKKAQMLTINWYTTPAGLTAMTEKKKLRSVPPSFSSLVELQDKIFTRISTSTVW